MGKSSGDRIHFGIGLCEELADPLAQRRSVRTSTDDPAAHYGKYLIDGVTEERGKVGDAAPLKADPGNQDGAIEVLDVAAETFVGSADNDSDHALPSLAIRLGGSIND